MSLHELVKLLITAVGQDSAAPSLLWVGVVSLGALLGVLHVLAEESRRRTLQALLAAAKPGTMLCDRRGRRNEVLIVHLPSSPAVSRHGSPDRSG